MANNGGPTANLALKSDGDATNRIPNAHLDCKSVKAVGVDQRGMVRPQESAEGCDVGAYEIEDAESCEDENRQEGGLFAAVYPGAGAACLNGGSLSLGGAINPVGLFMLLMLAISGLFRSRATSY